MDPIIPADDATADEYPSDPGKIRLTQAIKASARATLYTEDHFHKAVIACFLPILFFCLLFVYIDAAAFFFDLLSGALPEILCQVLFVAVSLIAGAIFAFFIFAMIAGVYGFVSGLKTGEGSMTTIPDTADLNRILSPIASRGKMKETLFAFLYFLLFVIPALFPVILFVFLGRRFLFPDGGILFAVITAALFVILFIYTMLVLYDMAAVPYLSHDGISDQRERMRVSRRIMKKHRIEALRLLFSFVPLMVLSLLTLGLLLFFYVLPYMAIAYGKLAESAYLEYKENI